jgi:glycosyltransferase involved in cell wall biosynthesis
VQILYFADTRFPIERANGVQTMATCHALASRGHDVTLVVRPAAGTTDDPFTFYGLPPEPRLSLQRVGGSGVPQARRARFLLSAAALALRAPGVVVTRDLGVAAFLLQAPFARRARVVYESHGVADVVAAELPSLLGGTPPPSRAKLARLARREARVWRHARSYVTLTRVLADELTERFGPRDRVFVVPDGAPVAADRAQTTTRTVTDPFVVGYAGHLYPWKGVDVLITALARVPEASALIVGGHPAERDRARVEALVQTLGASDRITFSGQVGPPQVAALLARASVLALPNTSSAISERYTSPLKLFEYLAAGKAIVASDLPAIREILRDGETALLVPPGDPLALAAALDRLRADPEMAARLGAAAARLAPEYSWAKRAERLETALQAALA